MKIGVIYYTINYYQKSWRKFFIHTFEMVVNDSFLIDTNRIWTQYSHHIKTVFQIHYLIIYLKYLFKNYKFLHNKNDKKKNVHFLKH